MSGVNVSWIISPWINGNSSHDIIQANKCFGHGQASARRRWLRYIDFVAGISFAIRGFKTDGHHSYGAPTST